MNQLEIVIDFDITGPLNWINLLPQEAQSYQIRTAYYYALPGPCHS